LHYSRLNLIISFILGFRLYRPAGRWLKTVMTAAFPSSHFVASSASFNSCRLYPLRLDRIISLFLVFGFSCPPERARPQSRNDRGFFVKPLRSLIGKFQQFHCVIPIESLCRLYRPALPYFEPLCQIFIIDLTIGFRPILPDPTGKASELKRLRPFCQLYRQVPTRAKLTLCGSAASQAFSCSALTRQELKAMRPQALFTGIRLYPYRRLQFSLPL